MIISKLLSVGGVLIRSKKARLLIGAAKLVLLAYAVKKGEPEPKLKLNPNGKSKVKIEQ